MKFDVSKVYTSVNADEVKIGSIGYFADNLKSLHNLVQENRETQKDIILDILDTSNGARFAADCYGCLYNLFYLVEEPKEEKHRPYKNIEEFLEDYCHKYRTSYECPNIWVKDRVHGCIKLQITGYDFDLNKVLLYKWMSLEEFFEKYIYSDGSPCGKKIGVNI